MNTKYRVFYYNAIASWGEKTYVDCATLAEAIDAAYDGADVRCTETGAQFRLEPAYKRLPMGVQQ